MTLREIIFCCLATMILMWWAIFQPSVKRWVRRQLVNARLILDWGLLWWLILVVLFCSVPVILSVILPR